MRDALDLFHTLAQAPGRYDLFMALRLIECAHPELPRIGAAARPRQEALRFAQRPTLGFATDMIEALEKTDAGWRLLVNGFGLLGANGPMPLHFTEYVRDRQRNANDTALAGFLDLFLQRTVSLFYRAWADAQPTVSLDRPAEDRFSAYVASLLGLGEASLRGRDAAPDFARLHFAGHFGRHVRNAEGLAALLSEFFQTQVSLRQFVGAWMTLPADGQSRLYGCGRGRGRQGGALAPCQLGVSTVLGRRVWNHQDKFRIRLGPLSFAQYQAFLPGGDSIKRLTALVHSYVGLALAWDVNLVLKKEEVPPLRLGRGARLGWSSWLSRAHPAQDDDQFVLHSRCRA